GDLLMLLVLVMPLLRLLGPRLRPWIDRQFVAPHTREIQGTHAVAITVGSFAVLGLVVFLGVHQALGTIEVAIDTRTAGGELLIPKLREITLAMGLLSTALILATGIFSTSLARLGERQRREAREDSLTGCLNRRAFAGAFAREAERSRRLGLGLGVLLLDLDRFKAVNDRNGHQAGDVVLARAARRIEGALRETDLLFRWGGEEFVVLMAHIRPAEVAEVAERVRAAVSSAPLLAVPGQGELTVTVSIGAAGTDTFPADPADLVANADRACYQAKAQGRDRVVTV
ncbi:MAG: GGDEF domain-containing protein, partial [Thermoanaerobaculia bacterium]|nr:GGDEF domain-containing protein [Thermoanaerobaculia bacterium]